MKKVVRTVWIGLLSGLAFMAACTSSKNCSEANASAKPNQEEMDEMNARLDRIEQRIKEMKTPDGQDKRAQLHSNWIPSTISSNVVKVLAFMARQR